MTWSHPGPTKFSGFATKRVAILALGPSIGDYFTLHFNKGGFPDSDTPGAHGYFSEIWTMNRGIKVLPHHVAFILDDLQAEIAKDADYASWIRDEPMPIITSTVYPNVAPDLHAYPLREVINWLGPGTHGVYLRNSVPMMLAYAGFIGVQEIVLFGADYTSAHGAAAGVRESWRANCEYMVAVLRERGVRVGIPQNSTLCATNEPLSVYGYLDVPSDALDALGYTPGDDGQDGGV